MGGRERLCRCKRPAAEVDPAVTTMTEKKENTARLGTKSGWSVVVVYEDLAARERAVSFCDQLVGRFWERRELEVNWWPFALLEQAESAAEAAERAARADLIVFSACSEGDFPTAIRVWIECWLDRRGEREGLLAGLLEPAAAPAGREGPKHHCLRKAAHRADMDYLTQVPQGISRAMPDSLDSFSRRAEQMTSVLDEILRHQPPPPSLPA